MATDADCLFCRIVAGEIPAEIVHETAGTVAFRDIDAQAPTHVLVIPRRHEPNAAALAAVDPEGVAELLTAAATVADKEGLEQGYRLVFNTRPQAHQTGFHAHLPLLRGPSMGWPAR